MKAKKNSSTQSQTEFRSKQCYSSALLIDLQSQEYGSKYWTVVCDVGTVMESFANYLRYARSIGAGSSDD